ncbi:mCG142327 [Mus musculus]|nr:mCG142327 [Mus musculus]
MSMEPRTEGPRIKAGICKQKKSVHLHNTLFIPRKKTENPQT